LFDLPQLDVVVELVEAPSSAAAAPLLVRPRLRRLLLLEVDVEVEPALFVPAVDWRGWRADRVPEPTIGAARAAEAKRAEMRIVKRMLISLEVLEWLNVSK